MQEEICDWKKLLSSDQWAGKLEILKIGGRLREHKQCRMDVESLHTYTHKNSVKTNWTSVNTKTIKTYDDGLSTQAVPELLQIWQEPDCGEASIFWLGIRWKAKGYTCVKVQISKRKLKWHGIYMSIVLNLGPSCTFRILRFGIPKKKALVKVFSPRILVCCVMIFFFPWLSGFQENG